MKVKTYQMTEETFEQTFDWYSRSRYISPANVVRMLRRQGYSDKAVAAILQSKWTRRAVAELVEAIAAIVRAKRTKGVGVYGQQALELAIENAAKLVQI